MSVMDRAYQRAEGSHQTVVFPEWNDPRITEARKELEARGLCHPIPLNDAKDELVDVLIEARGLKPSIAQRMLQKPMIHAAAVVAAGQADAMIAGADTPTQRVIKAAGLAIGLAEGVDTPSSFFLMRFPDKRELIFADCAVNAYPTSAELADIARASHQTAVALLGEARLALLSFSTGASGTGPSVDAVREAAELTGFAGPIQADAALNSVIAKTKKIEPADANTLIFPSLDAGNIAYKLCQELGHAQAVGPILQGFRKPVCDLSRGATPQDIIDATVLTLALNTDGKD